MQPGLGWAGLGRAGLGWAGLGWASMGHRRDGDSMVCRDAGSRDHMPHACCMLHAAVWHHQAPAGGSQAVRVDTAVSYWWTVELEDILEKSAQSLMNVHLLVEM